MLIAIVLHEYLVNEKGVTIALVFSLQSPGEFGAKFDTPQADRFAADRDTSIRKQIFDISVTQIESIVQSN